jgi:enamine deaminase RidA (YjgF/YER057c/UK114 family)
MSLTQTSPDLSACRLLFGSEASAIVDGETPALRLAVPPLDGSPADVVFQGTPSARGVFSIYEQDGCIAGIAVGEEGEPVEAATSRLYRSLLESVGGLSLYRIWNYVPHINAPDEGLETYRRFSRARSLQLEAHFGQGFATHLPAASAVGAIAGSLAIAFVAGSAEPKRFENPRQVPAYAYPSEHGPRPPSFCRALRVSIGPEEVVFISGTAAIRGHASIAAANIATQVACTVENLEAIAHEAGAGHGIGTTGGWRRRFTVYLRHPADLAAARSLLAGTFRPADHVSFVQAEVCRSELLIEIECTLRRAL